MVYTINIGDETNQTSGLRANVVTLTHNIYKTVTSYITNQCIVVCVWVT